MSKKSNWQFKLLWGLGLAPLLIAWVMAATGWGIPDTTKNYGELVLVDSKVPQGLTELHRGRWGLLFMSDECAEGCLEQFILMQQVHKSLGKEFNRLQSIWLGSSGQELFPSRHMGEIKGSIEGTSDDIKKVNVESIESWFDKNNLPVNDNSIWLIDPTGNLVLRFIPGLKGKEMISDIRWLLKVSRLG